MANDSLLHNENIASQLQCMLESAKFFCGNRVLRTTPERMLQNVALQSKVEDLFRVYLDDGNIHFNHVMFELVRSTSRRGVKLYRFT